MFRNGNRRRVGQLAGQLEVEISVPQSEIFGLILRAKNGNYAVLRQLVLTVKVGVVTDKKIAQSTLLENKEFLPVIAKCFTTNDHALQLDALSILVWIAENGRSNEAELMIRSPVIPTLVASLNCQKKTVRDESLNFLRIISENDASVEVFSKADILPTLRKVARQTTNLDSLLNIGYTLCNVFRSGYLEKAGDDGSTLLSMKGTFHEVMPLLRILAQTADKRIMETVTSFVKLTSKLDEAVKEEIRSSGIHQLISDGEKPQVKADPVNMTVPAIPKVEIDTQLDGSQVLAAIVTIATGNAKTRSDKKLQRVTSSMMKCLKEDEAFTTEIFGCDGLIDFLLTCLKPNRNYTVQLAGVHIISLILSDGTDDLKKSLLVSGLVPAVAALLPRGHGQLCDKALSTLRTFCEAGDVDWTRKVTAQLHRTKILPALISLARQTVNKSWFFNICWVYCTFCTGNHRITPLATGTNDKVGPPVEAIRDITTLAKVLLNVGEYQITRQVILSLTIVVTIEGCHRAIFESGILPTVVPYTSLDHPLKFAAGNFMIVAALGGGMDTSNVRILEFFRCLKYNQGMKDFYKVVDGIDGEIERYDSATTIGLINFFRRVTVAMFPESDEVTLLGALECKIVEVALESGFLHTIVKCLEEGRPTPIRCRKFTVYLLVSISNITFQRWTGFLVDAGAIPALVDLLESAEKDSECYLWVLTGLAHVAALSADARDQIVDSGGISKLFGLIVECTDDVEKLRCMMDCMCKIMLRKPTVPVTHFEELPACLRHILTDENLQQFRRDSEASTQIFMERVCDCIQVFAEHGREQVEQLERKGLLKDIVNALNFGEHSTREAAIMAVATICRNKADCRDEFVRLGIVEYLPGLLESPLKYARKASVLLMTKVFHHELTAAQRKIAKKAFSEQC